MRACCITHSGAHHKWHARPSTEPRPPRNPEISTCQDIEKKSEKRPSRTRSNTCGERHAMFITPNEVFKRNKSGGGGGGRREVGGVCTLPKHGSVQRTTSQTQYTNVTEKCVAKKKEGTGTLGAEPQLRYPGTRLKRLDWISTPRSKKEKWIDIVMKTEQNEVQQSTNIQWRRGRWLEDRYDLSSILSRHKPQHSCTSNEIKTKPCSLALPARPSFCSGPIFSSDKGWGEHRDHT